MKKWAVLFLLSISLNLFTNDLDKSIQIIGSPHVQTCKIALGKINDSQKQFVIQFPEGFVKSEEDEEAIMFKSTSKDSPFAETIIIIRKIPGDTSVAKIICGLDACVSILAKYQKKEYFDMWNFFTENEVFSGYFYTTYGNDIDSKSLVTDFGTKIYQGSSEAWAIEYLFKHPHSVDLTKTAMSEIIQLFFAGCSIQDI
ncbi:MAG: hypothetical protein K1000chlam2_01189 [Chlamydiae bacterium]|nr:hypothetical protein [Chlamydiota bacterium]